MNDETEIDEFNNNQHLERKDDADNLEFPGSSPWPAQQNHGDVNAGGIDAGKGLVWQFEEDPDNRKRVKHRLKVHKMKVKPNTPYQSRKNRHQDHASDGKLHQLLRQNERNESEVKDDNHIERQDVDSDKHLNGIEVQIQQPPVVKNSIESVQDINDNSEAKLQINPNVGIHTDKRGVEHNEQDNDNRLFGIPHREQVENGNNEIEQGERLKEHPDIEKPLHRDEQFDDKPKPNNVKGPSKPKRMFQDKETLMKFRQERFEAYQKRGEIQNQSNFSTH